MTDAETTARGRRHDVRDFLVALAVVLAADGIFLAPRDGEFGWQRFLADTILHDRALPRTLGNETLTASGAPYLPQQWLFALLVRACLGSSAGYIAFAVLMAVTATSALGIAAATARELGASRRATFFAVLLAAVPVVGGYFLRAQMFVWPFVALLVRYTVTRDRAWRLVPLTIVWANVHASAVLVPVATSVAAVASYFDARRLDRATRTLATVAACCYVAVCATPFGIGLWQLAIGLETSPIHRYILEWRLPVIGSPATIVLLVMGAALMVGHATLRTWRVAVPAAFFFLFGLSARRDIAIGAIALVPFLSLALEPLARRLAARGRVDATARETPPEAARPGRRLVTLAASGAAIAVAIVALSTVAHPDRWFAAPPDIVSIRALPGDRNVYCDEFAYCSFALGQSGERVFLDGRADPYPLEVWREWREIADGGPRWATLLAHYHVNTVVANNDGPLTAALRRRPEWRRSYAGRGESVWIR